ncbi:DUF6571 family protein [Streptomyces sp. NPDC060198]|uniref:DUF6571 family protein n=1 Tax=Streptomyces sp. NPDC060198 TaxID=3347070 RepID=UPI00364CB9D1
MDLDALRFGNFSALDSAVSDWERQVKSLKTLQDEAQDGLKATAVKADWAGLNANVTRDFVTKTAAEFTDAHTQASSIAAILGDTRDELVSYRGQLVAAIERGVAKNLTVRDTGQGTFAVDMNIHPDRAAAGTQVPEHSRQDVDRLREEVQSILTKATESDATADEALRLLVDRAKYGFSDAGYQDRDSAANALKDAKEAAALYSKGSDMSNTELTRLIALMKENKDDPLFAERFATDLGPEKTLSLYADLADDQQFYVHPRSGSGLSEEMRARMRLLGGLESSLGATLATATHSGSGDMAQWQRDLLVAGGKDVGTPGQDRVHGYQVMSNLMRNGAYEDDFLKSYGDSLIAFEKENTSDEVGGLQRRTTREDVLPWNHSGAFERLHYGAGNDAGSDPMTGFMEALGHNAEASTDFFDEGTNFDYLTEDREWFEDHAKTDAKTIAGYDSLGHALESATKGAPYDADPPQLHRDSETAAVAQRVVERYGQDAEYKGDKQTGLSGAQLLAGQEGIGDSLGSIGAAYIDDINWAMDGNAEKSVYALDDGGRTSSAERAHFDNSELGLTKFISTLGQDPDAYASLGTAQQVYTTSLLHEHPPTIEADGDVSSSEAETVLRNGAEVQGVLDRSRAEEIKAGGVEADKKYNDAVDARIERDKMIAGAVTGGLFSLTPEATTGVAATVVPIVGEQTEGVVGGLIEKNLDEYAEAHHRDNSEKYHAEGNEVYASGFAASWRPGHAVLQEADASSAWDGENYRKLSDALTRAQQLGYNSGSQQQENVGQLPTT